MVFPAGFEPCVAAVRRRNPRPLDDGNENGVTGEARTRNYGIHIPEFYQLNYRHRMMFAKSFAKTNRHKSA